MFTSYSNYRLIELAVVAVVEQTIHHHNRNNRHSVAAVAAVAEHIRLHIHRHKGLAAVAVAEDLLHNLHLVPAVVAVAAVKMDNILPKIGHWQLQPIGRKQALNVRNTVLIFSSYHSYDDEDAREYLHIGDGYVMMPF